MEMAPIDLTPCSAFKFLEMDRGYKSGGFHLNSGHILQATVKHSTTHEPLAFQECLPSFPHIKGTVGCCGRPSSVCWHVSVLDDSQNHGTGSQQNIIHARPLLTLALSCKMWLALHQGHIK